LKVGVRFDKQNLRGYWSWRQPRSWSCMSYFILVSFLCIHIFWGNYNNVLMLIVYGCCLQQCNSLIYFHLNPFHLIIYSSGLSMLILAMICFSAKFWCDYSRLYISAWILAMVCFNAKFCFSFTLCPVVSLWRNTAWSYTLFLKDTKKNKSEWWFLLWSKEQAWIFFSRYFYNWFSSKVEGSLLIFQGYSSSHE
jgi:hypothetical protein